MNLTDIKQGKTVKIVKFGGNLKFKMRLVEMGIKVGSVAKLLTKNESSVIIQIDQNRYILGFEIINKIEVEEIN